MARFFRGMRLVGVLATLALLLYTRPLAAQNGDKGEPVRITTADGVTLHGMFYQSSKKDAPAIIFLHNVGDKGLQKPYYNMAEALSANYSVMLFDFRGHGKSKDVNANEFWKQPANLNPRMIRGAKPTKTSIEFNEFSPNYLPVLVNDIASVKAYLDRRNDARDCNTSSTILIGAEQGATLGAIWLNSQWSLTRMIPNPNNPLLQPVAAPNPEGKDVMACIWMSIESSLSTTKAKGYPVNVTGTLRTPVGVHACPTVFMFGEANTKDKDRAHALVNAFKKGDDKKYEFVVPYAIKGTNLRGISLATKSLQLDKTISGYLEQVVDKRGGEWSKRDFEKSTYMWRDGRQAKMLGMDPKNLMFNTYEQYIGR